MKIIFCEKNKELLKKVKEVFKNETNNLHCELITEIDVFKAKKKYPNALITTTSNPDFSMGGGLDALIKGEYPEQCKSPREFKFTKDLFFTITVDKNIKSSKSIVQRALLGIYFASRKNDIIFTGLGTVIGGLSIDDFISELKKFVNADFGSANFSFADFGSADFRSADFRSADFSFANFRFADFSFADFKNSIFNYRITPEIGKFIGWKKAQGKIIKLEIQKAENVSGGLIGRKLRTDKVKVLEIQDKEGKKLDLKKISSDYNEKFIYNVGKIITEKGFKKDDKIECGKGIHFFMTRDEAVIY